MTDPSGPINIRNIEPEDLIREREKTHGNFVHQGALAAILKSMVHADMKDHGGPIGLHQVECIDLILTKISRIVHGDAQEIDHWNDIAGYAKLGKLKITSGG